MSAVIGGLCVLVVLPLCGALLLGDAEWTMDSGMKKTGRFKTRRN